MMGGGKKCIVPGPAGLARFLKQVLRDSTPIKKISINLRAWIHRLPWQCNVRTCNRDEYRNMPNMVMYICGGYTAFV